MFSMDSMLREVNINGKVISYFLILIALLLVKSPLFLIFVNILLLLVTKGYHFLFGINMISLIITIIEIVFSQFLWITKTLILIIYTVLLKKITKTIELRYILENTLYRFQTKKITYKILYIIYFGKYFKNNLKRMLILKDDYHLDNNTKLIKFLIRQSYQKTKNNMQEFMQIYQLRFYNYSKNRTYIEKNNWESWDTNYVMLHIIFILLVCFYGR